jgi:hypothetical protein
MGAITSKAIAVDWRGPALRAISLPLVAPAAEAAAILLSIPLMLGVALWNGFPIIFYDTGAYVLEGLGRVFMPERPPVYSLFVNYAGGGVSLWFVALAQATIAAFVAAETARCVAPRMSFTLFLGIVGALVLLTGVSWYVGQIEPDCFAALAILSLYILAFHREAVAGWREAALVGSASLSIAAHTSHLLLGLGLVVVIALYRFIVFVGGKFVSSEWSLRWPRPRLFLPSLCCALGLSLVAAANFELADAVFISRAGPAFVFARLLQDGIVMRLLDDTCPQSHYRLCAYKDVLPRTAVQWLWGRGSPFFEMGRFSGTDAESSRIIWDSLRRYPLMQAQTAFSDTVDQFVSFKTGDQIEPQEWVLSKPFEQLIPAQMRSYLAARQQKGMFGFGRINLIHESVGWISLVLLCPALFLLLHWGRRKEAVFLGFLLIALIGNATICGALSTPHDRYQSRLMWIVPFGLALIAANRSFFALRGGEESGT